jgi:hypothetical protein
LGHIKIADRIVPLWFIGVLLISGIGLSVLAYVWQSVIIPFEVEEPLEILSYPSEFSLFPSETIEFNITLQNHASINYSVMFDYQLDDSYYQANYVRFSDETYNVSSGIQTLTAWLFVEPNAPPTQASLTINLLRIKPVTPTIVIYPSDDSFVGKEAIVGYDWVNTTDWNYGNATSLVVSTTTVDGRDRRAFLKFSLSSISSPEDIVSVKLFLFKTGNYPPAWGGVGNVEARKVADDSWTEHSITWNNQIAYGSLLDTTHIVFLSSEWYSWDVTPFILDELAGDKVASICLKAENEDQGNTYRWSSFYSKEYDDFDPYLLVTRHDG